MISALIGVLIIVVIGAICFWAIDSLPVIVDWRSCSSCSSY
jgi:hypothetical protein